MSFLCNMGFTDGELEKSWRSWIREHETADVAALALRISGKKDLPAAFLLRQVKGLQTAKNKLPLWYHTPGIVFPDTLILEQCSSETTASFKASLVKANRLADLTGGLGVDTAAFARHVSDVLYFEPDAHRCETAKHNFAALGLSHIRIHQSTAEEALQEVANFQPDLLFLDPSRRGDNKQKVFRIQDLQPDVLQLKESLLKIAPKVLVKFAPMLDITEGLRQLPETSQVHIVSWKGECRELLFLLERNSSVTVKISCVELEENFPTFSFSSTENSGLPEFSEPKKYLYEPTAAVSKSGAWKALADQYKVKALHANTHLFTSEESVPFPGRSFEIIDVLPYDASTIKAALPEGKAQLIFRNFPVDAATVVKKLKIPSSEPYYLFFVTINSGEPKVILSRRN